MVHKYYVFLMTLLVVCTLVACNDSNKPENQSSEQKTNPIQQQSERSNENVEIVFFGLSNGEEEFNDRWGDSLRKQFPDYKITYIQNGEGQTLHDLITTGQPIDIIFASIGVTASSLIENGFEYDITDLARKHQVDLNRFEPTFLESIKQMGGLYGLPVNGGGLVLYYNKDIFDQFGVGYPSDGMTWDELLDLAKQVTREHEGKQYYGFATSVAHSMRMNPYSLDIVDKQTGKAAIDNDIWRKIMQVMIVEPVVMDEGYLKLFQSRNGGLWTNDFVREQNLAMFMMNFGLQFAVPEFENMNWDMVSIPVFEDNPGVGSQPYPNFFYITATSKHKDAAMEMLKYVTSDEHAMIESRKGNIPVLTNQEIKDMFGEDTIFKDKNMKNAVFYHDFAPPQTKTIYDDIVTRHLNTNMNKVIFGEIDLNTAFRNAIEAANQEIAEKMKAKEEQ